MLRSLPNKFVRAEMGERVVAFITFRYRHDVLIFDQHQPCWSRILLAMTPPRA